MRGVALGLEDGAPGAGRVSLIALFHGPSVEAPGAKASTLYSQNFTCEAGPVDIAGTPVWVLPGGIMCKAACGDGALQILKKDDGTWTFTTTGLTLTEQPGGACGAGTALTTRGNFAVGYPLAVSDNPGHCAPIEGY